MSVEEEFVSTLRDHFARLTPMLDAELAIVQGRSYPKEVKFLFVDYDSAHFGDDFAVSMWPCMLAATWQERAIRLAGSGRLPSRPVPTVTSDLMKLILGASPLI
jgi:hypothetical protein